MKRNLIFIGQWLVTALFLVIGLSSYGCADTASVSEDVAAPLASLTVTPGGLQSAFFANTTNYAVNAPTSATSVTVTAVPKDNTATVTINGIVTAAGQGRSVALGSPGSTTTILIVVETQTGLETTYTVTVTRLLSSDNNLSALTVTPGSLTPTFTSSTLDYTVNVATNVTSMTVSATKSDSNAVMTGSLTAESGVATGQASIPLNGPGTATPVTITMIAPNGSAKTYTVTVNRAAPSSNNNLSALSVTSGILAPAFAPDQLPYTVDVSTGVTSLTITATKADPNAVMTGSLTAGAGVATGQASIPLNGPGTATPVTITVIAPNGNAKTYTITVNRAAPSSDTNLSALNVTGGPLVPDFAPGTTAYTVDVPSSVDNVTVSGTKSDSNAVMSGDLIAGTGVPAGQATVLLIPLFPRTVLITVTAPNGDSKIYSVTITRAFF
jgi:Cadherin-like beta sandwich domain